MTQICVIDDSPIAGKPVGQFLVSAGLRGLEVFDEAESGVLKSLVSARTEASTAELSRDLEERDRAGVPAVQAAAIGSQGQGEDLRAMVKTQELILKTRQAALLSSGWLCADRSLLRALLLALAKAERVTEAACAQLDASLHRLYRFETLHPGPGGSVGALAQTRQVSSLLATLARETLPLIQERPADVIQLCAQLVFLGRERWDGAGEPFGLKGGATPHLARVFSLANRMAILMAARHLGGEQLSLGDTMRTLHAEAGAVFDPDLLASLHAAAQDLGLLGHPAAGSGVMSREVHGARWNAAAEAIH